MANDLPRDVHRELSRHGREVFYFRAARGRRIRLPEFGTDAFRDAVASARAGVGRPYRPAVVTAEALRQQRIERTLRTAILRAGVTSKRLGMPCDLDLDWALALVDRQKARCALSGVPFFADAPLSGGRHPFAPSLDRVKAGGSYTRDNVRIVTFAMNVMLLDWGHDVFEQVANGYRVNRGKSRFAGPIPEPKTQVRAASEKRSQSNTIEE